MSTNSGAKALRAAGYVKCPSWWVTGEQLELIRYMALKNKPDIDRIKDKVEQQSQKWGHNSDH